MNTPCANDVAESGSESVVLLSTLNTLSPVLNTLDGTLKIALKLPCSSVESAGTFADTVACATRYVVPASVYVDVKSPKSHDCPEDTFTVVASVATLVVPLYAEIVAVYVSSLFL